MRQSPLKVMFATVALWMPWACSSSTQRASTDAGADFGMPIGHSDSATGRALDWILGALNGAPITETDVRTRFSASFLAQVTPAQLEEALTELTAFKPWVLVGIESASGGNRLTAVVTHADGQYWRILVATDLMAQIGGLLLQPAGDLDPTLKSWSSVNQAAGALAPNVNLLAATLDGVTCSPLHSLAPEASLAIGSTFKLWVLAKLAEDIGSGKHTLADTIAIDDAHKSLPSGVLQDQAPGTLLPLMEYAKQMISISDNTAADHLLSFLGREAVEATLIRTGHHNPAQNQPFLSTREMFNLKMMVTPAERQAYIDAPMALKRALLVEHDGRYDPRTYAGPPWITPVAIDKIEWFATTADLCGVMRTLKEYGDQPATQQVYDVLALSPGIADPSNAFEYVGFKGGSEPGVLNLTWLLRRRTDQAWLFLTIGVNDNVNPIDDLRAIYVAQAARGLLTVP